MADMEKRRGTGISLWRQIQEILEGEIKAGVFQPGTQLPTEFQLASRFGVNRHTVRRALSGLEEKGLLRVEQGRGTFVHESVIDYKLGKRTRFTANLSQLNRNPGGVLLASTVMPADAAIARALSVAEGTPVIHMRTAREADGRRVNFSDRYLPHERFAGIPDLYAACGSITESFFRLGLEDYTRRSSRILARMPSGADAALIGQPRTRPLLVVEGINIDREGTPVEFCITRWASDWVQLVIEP